MVKNELINDSTDNSVFERATKNDERRTKRTDFGDLPEELRFFIIELAGRTSLSSDSDSPLAWNLVILSNLALVSRRFQDYITPLLYETVSLTTPSQLALFHRGLSLQPARGQLIKNLHIGPTALPSKGWWPIKTSEDMDEDGIPTGHERTFVQASLCNARGEKPLPRWCSHEARFDWEDEECSSEHRAVKAAMRAAGRDIVVDPAFSSRGPGSEHQLGIVSTDSAIYMRGTGLVL